MTTKSVNLFQAILNWFSYWWIKVPEPRFINLVFGVSYLAAFGSGVYILFSPSIGHISFANESTMIIIGWFLIIGGFVSMVAGTIEAWKIERISLSMMMLALVAFGLLAIGYPGIHPSIKAAMVTLVVCSLSLFVVRLAMIWGFTYRPRG